LYKAIACFAHSNTAFELLVEEGDNKITQTLGKKKKWHHCLLFTGCFSYVAK
jgi:hypothetical protein